MHCLCIFLKNSLCFEKRNFNVIITSLSEAFFVYSYEMHSFYFSIVENGCPDNDRADLTTAKTIPYSTNATSKGKIATIGEDPFYKDGKKVRKQFCFFYCIFKVYF